MYATDARTSLLALLAIGIATLSGCGGKDGTPKGDGGSGQPKSGPVDLATATPDVKFTPAEYLAENKKQPDFLMEKYAGKVAEITGEAGRFGSIVFNGTPTQSVMFVGGTDRRWPEPRIDLSDKEPWLKALPGQTVTVRVKVPTSRTDPAVGPTGLVWKMTNVSGTVPAVSAEELAREFKADAAACKKKYGGRYIVVAGTIVGVKRGTLPMWGDIELGTEAASISCEVLYNVISVAPAESQLAKIKAGEKVKMVAWLTDLGLSLAILLEPTN